MTSRQTLAVLRRAVAACALAAVLASTAAAAPTGSATYSSRLPRVDPPVAGQAAAHAGNVPYAIGDIGPAPVNGFKVSDIGAAATSGHDTVRASERPQDAYRISDLSPAWSANE